VQDRCSAAAGLSEFMPCHTTRHKSYALPHIYDYASVGFLYTGHLLTCTRACCWERRGPQLVCMQCAGHSCSCACCFQRTFMYIRQTCSCWAAGVFMLPLRRLLQVDMQPPDNRLYSTSHLFHSLHASPHSTPYCTLSGWSGTFWMAACGMPAARPLRHPCLG
jgi:hypothetical protein